MTTRINNNSQSLPRNLPANLFGTELITDTMSIRDSRSTFTRSPVRPIHISKGNDYHGHSRTGSGMVGSVSDWNMSRPASMISDSNDRFLHSYMIAGVGTDPRKWLKAQAEEQDLIQHRTGAIRQFFRPEVLGSSPPAEDNIELRRTFQQALQACFPVNLEVCTGKSAPDSTYHSFVLQRTGEAPLYGVALCVYTHANCKRSETLRAIQKELDDEKPAEPDHHYWIPSALCFLSQFPLYDLLSDYLREMWLHWKLLRQVQLAHSGYVIHVLKMRLSRRSTELSREISRLLRLFAPTVSSCFKLDLKNVTLFYNLPSTLADVQNFPLWPLFACLPLSAVVKLVEVALSPSGRIAFRSQHISMLNIAAETIRFLIRSFNWNGLYVPVAHVHNIEALLNEKGPSIVGYSSKADNLVTVPGQTHLVDLDNGIVSNSSVSSVIMTEGQKNKLMNRLAKALGGWDTRSGVPFHLRIAYEDGKPTLCGSFVPKRDVLKTLQVPEWWDQDAILAIFERVAIKACKLTGLKSILTGGVKKPLTTSVSVNYINELVRDRNACIREVKDVWQDMLDGRKISQAELLKTSDQCNVLVGELDKWKMQFEKFQEITTLLATRSNELKREVDVRTRENKELLNVLENKRVEINRLRLDLSGTVRQRDEALTAIVQQQIITEELEKRRQKGTKELAELEHRNATFQKQQDEAQKILHQIHQMIDDDRSCRMSDVAELLSKTVDSNEKFQSNPREWPRLDNAPRLERPRTMTKTRSSYHLPRPRSITARRSTSYEDESTESTEASPIKQRNSRHLAAAEKRFPRLSVVESDDMRIRSKISAVSEIIKRITEQCATAMPDPEKRDPYPSADNNISIPTVEQIPPPVADLSGNTRCISKSTIRHSVLAASVGSSPAPASTSSQTSPSQPSTNRSRSSSAAYSDKNSYADTNNSSNRAQTPILSQRSSSVYDSAAEMLAEPIAGFNMRTSMLIKPNLRGSRSAAGIRLEDAWCFFDELYSQLQDHSPKSTSAKSLDLPKKRKSRVGTFA